MSFELQRGTRLGNYELLVRIGRGGMANVWVARGRPDPAGPEQLVAIKAMLPELAQNMEFRSMFLDEGQIVRSIDHPSVVRVYEVAEALGVLYMVMEWVEGDSLHTLIAEANKRRPIPPELAVRMIADTASGLHAAHEIKGWDGELLGIVHCDVSPHNILIGLDGAVKLVDFGVAGAMNRVNNDDEAKIRGKFGYMSPEQAQAKTLDRRSDVFSLGIVLFELTTGYRLFRGRDDRHTLDLVIYGKIPRPSQVVEKYPAKLEAIVMKALERDINKRFQTADELRDALEAYLVSERILVPGAGIKGLLKRVLGQRLDERRTQIRESIRALDGSQRGLTLVSEDSVIADLEAISVSVSQVEPVIYRHHHTGPSSSSSSSMGAARLPSDASSGAHSVSHPGRPVVVSRRVPPAGYIAGAVIAVGAIVGVVLLANSGPDGPTVVEPKRPAAAARPATPGSPTPAPIERGTNSRRESHSIDSLPKVGEALDITNPRQPMGSSPVGPTPAPRSRPLEEDVGAMLVPSASADDQKVILKEDDVQTVADSVTLDDGVGQSPEPNTSSAGGFDQAAAAQVLGRAAGMVGTCYRPGGETGDGKAFITFATSGAVQSVRVLGKFAGTPVGQCIAGHFKRVTIPSFTGAAQTVSKGFSIKQ